VILANPPLTGTLLGQERRYRQAWILQSEIEDVPSPTRSVVHRLGPLSQTSRVARGRRRRGLPIRVDLGFQNRIGPVGTQVIGRDRLGPPAAPLGAKSGKPLRFYGCRQSASGARRRASVRHLVALDLRLVGGHVNGQVEVPCSRPRPTFSILFPRRWSSTTSRRARGRLGWPCR